MWQGTSITVEDLFYNVPNRLAALRSPADEFNRIADVVTRSEQRWNSQKSFYRVRLLAAGCSQSWVFSDLIFPSIT
jgi:hypothetical protein